MVVQTLAACGVDMNYKDETSGIRPIDFAAASGNAGVLRVFLNSGSHTSANLEEKCYLSEHPADCLSLLRAVKVAQTAATAGNLDWICSEVATGTIATPAQWMHLLSSEKAQKLLAWTAAAISDGKACFLALYGAARRETPKHISPLLIMQSSPLSLCRNGSFPRAALKTVHPSCLLLHNGITGVQQLIISCLVHRNETARRLIREIHVALDAKQKAERINIVSSVSYQVPPNVFLHSLNVALA